MICLQSRNREPSLHNNSADTLNGSIAIDLLVCLTKLFPENSKQFLVHAFVME